MQILKKKKILTKSYKQVSQKLKAKITSWSKTNKKINKKYIFGNYMTSDLISNGTCLTLPLLGQAIKHISNNPSKQ